MPAHADWLASLRAAGRSPITIDSYSRDLEQIGRTIGGDCTAHHKVAEFDQSTIDTLSERWQSAGASRSTELRRLAALRGFSSFLCVQGMDCGRVLSSKLPPPIRAGRVTLDEAELDALTGSQQPSASNTAARDRAIVVLKAGTGVTTGELAALDLADIDLVHGTVNVVRTHLKPRVLRMAPEASEPLAAYVDGVRGTTPGPLFLSLRGTRLCPRSIQLMFRRLRRHQGVREDATLSSLRHTIGAGFAQSGASIENVALQLGMTVGSAARYFESGRKERP